MPYSARPFLCRTSSVGKMATRVIRVRPPVAAWIERNKGPGDTADDVLRRLLGMPSLGRQHAGGPKPGPKSGGYGHAISPLGNGHYSLTWRYDVSFGKARHRVAHRTVDRAAAERFAQRWGLALP